MSSVNSADMVLVGDLFERENEQRNIGSAPGEADAGRRR
jgi:hypothetical protein